MSVPECWSPTCEPSQVGKIEQNEKIQKLCTKLFCIKHKSGYNGSESPKLFINFGIKIVFNQREARIYLCIR